MKTTLWRVLCVCLAVLLSFGMTACGAPEDDSILGSWTYHFEFDSFGVENMKQHLTLTFREDGTFSFAPHEDNMRREIETHIDEMMAYAMEQSGLDMTKEEYYTQQSTNQTAMIDEIVQMMTYYGSEGTYETDGDKLYLLFGEEEKNEEHYYLFSLESGQLILTMPHEFTPTYTLAPTDRFPLTLYRM